MAKSSGLGMSLFIGGYDISGTTGAIDSISTPRGVQDVTVINQSAMSRLLSHTDAQLGFSSFFDDASSAWTLLSALPTTQQTVIAAKSSTRGAVAFGMQGKQVNFDPSRGADGGLTIATQVQGDPGTAPGWGVMLTAGAETHASAGSTASVDQAASSASGIGIWAQAFSLGSGTPTLLVEDSANDSSWATLATLTINGANEHEYQRVAGSIDRYLRITTTGTFTNFAVAVMVRRFETVDIEAAA